METEARGLREVWGKSYAVSVYVLPATVLLSKRYLRHTYVQARLSLLDSRVLTERGHVYRTLFANGYPTYSMLYERRQERLQ